MNDDPGRTRAEQEEEEILEEKEAQVLRREGLEQELMQEGSSDVGERVDDVEEDDS